MIFPITQLENHPTGTINTGGIINGNWAQIEAIFANTGGGAGIFATVVSSILGFTPTPGLPAGGTTGQVLAKINDTDYNAEWVDPGSGSGPAWLANFDNVSINADEELELTVGSEVFWLALNKR